MTPDTGTSEIGQALAKGTAPAEGRPDRTQPHDLASEALFQALGDNAYELDEKFRFLTFNQACASYYGVEIKAALGRCIWQVLPQTRGTWLDQLLKEVMASRRPRRIARAGLVHPERWIEVTAFPTARGLGVAFRDRSAEHQATEALRESESRLRLAVEAGRMGAWEYHITERRVAGSRELNQLLGFPADSTPGIEEIHARYWPGEQERVQAIGEAAMARGERFLEAEYRYLRPDGSLRWHLMRAEVRFGADDQPERIVGVLLDITERKEAEERQSLLMREVDHRAKNALAVLQAAVRLTQAQDLESYKRALEGRVSALARAQSLLADERWAGTNLRALLTGELDIFLKQGQRATLRGPSVALPARAAQPLAMAFHELATNAVKYGALSTPTGKVAVSWRLEMVDSPVLHLRWEESGGPPVEQPGGRGFGSRLLEGTVRGQLRGSVTLEWERTGLVCDIAVPLSPGAEAEGARADDAGRR
ncbi:PAS domain S-box protein [Roseomonas sp. SSH11]|uniref:histidine kinase n=1 Tax=Pararoseomonas baculiformis TaxID=2820812 RepID=A0ABS4AEM2_9PROT|nr:HWE histidine kinase domain-containing protein [Pararoseomonas baculiformis]MBP0445470.1 PAS domain S-box protein [Pararoseomonas baculiformis]